MFNSVFSSSLRDMLDDPLNIKARLCLNDSIDCLLTGSCRCETIKPFVVDIEMPGVSKENIAVKFFNEYLMINWKDRQGTSHTYKYRVPDTYYNRNKITCKYENGLLSITIPIREEPNNEVEVKIE